MNDAEHPDIKAAVDAVRAREDARTDITVPVMKQAHRWTDESAVTLTAPADPKHPTLMIWNPEKSAWRLILLPASSEWAIKPRKVGAPIWTPTEGE